MGKFRKKRVMVGYVLKSSSGESGESCMICTNDLFGNKETMIV